LGGELVGVLEDEERGAGGDAGAFGDGEFFQLAGEGRGDVDELALEVALVAGEFSGAQPVRTRAAPTSSARRARELAGEEFFMFFATGGGEEAAEEEFDGTGADLAGGELEAVQRGGLEEALQGMQVEFDGEGGVEIGADHAGDLALFDEATEDVGDGLLAHFVDEIMQGGSEALEIAQRVGRDGLHPLHHALGETPEFLGEIEIPVAQQRIGFGADFGAQIEDHGADDGVLPSKCR